MLTAAIDWALLGRRPTIMVSTIAIEIQPISARTSGRARYRVGRSSERKVDQESIYQCKWGEGKKKRKNSERR
jgi:hypothetical protein